METHTRISGRRIAPQVTHLVSLASLAAAALLLASCNMAAMGGGSAVGSLSADREAGSAILSRLDSIRTLASTVPANGDVNPYGVAEVKRSVGKLHAGSFLVSNFNNGANQQGTGSTIVQVAPNGAVSLFAQIDGRSLAGGVGLTTALVELSPGWVIVGSLPTTDGTAATAAAGALIVLDATGRVVETFSGAPINGPWDMTAREGEGSASLFLTNVLNGTVAANGSTVNEGTVVRVNLSLPGSSMPRVESMTVIGSGFPERTDPAALVIGPTGVGLGSPAERDGRNASLYVADSLNNRIAVIPNALERTTTAGIGTTLSSGNGLDDPLGLVVAPNGHVLVVNGNDGFATEISPDGTQVARRLLDSSGSPPGAGALFGLAFRPDLGVLFVDDATNTFNLLH